MSADIPDPYVVCVRFHRFSRTSPALAEADARAQAAALQDAVDRIGDGPGLIAFHATAGRDGAFRAREVVLIEVMPWTERMGDRDSEHGGRSFGTGRAASGGVQVQVYGQPTHGSPPGAGTDFLRQQAGLVRFGDRR